MEKICIVLIFLFYSIPGNCEKLYSEVVLPLTIVDVEGDQNTFSTPFDYYNGEIFTVHVEPPNGVGKDGSNLQTVVRKGERNDRGKWIWQSNTIEPRTIRDKWHAQASIAVDKNGYVHVAYNMHNMPWQYSVSSKSRDITSWIFKGQAISQDDIDSVKFLNKTLFPQIGSAIIPGNQITYPMFFKDINGELYITYRYALKPAQSWNNRAFAGGIAKYNTIDQAWNSIGGPVRVTNDDARFEVGKLEAIQLPFAYEEGFSVYFITLAFDKKNGMHVFWHWREGGAGANVTKPSYAYSPDGKSFYSSNGVGYHLPISLNNAELFVKGSGSAEYYAPKSIGILDGNMPAVILQPIPKGREIIFMKSPGYWSTPIKTPDAAGEIVIDSEGNQWVFSTGLKVFKKSKASKTWSQLGKLGNNLCNPKAKYIPLEGLFFIHAKTCDGKQATIISFWSRQ